MSISPARKAAFEILMRVSEQAAYATDLLHSSRTLSLSEEDRALAYEIVMGVLRWRSRLDSEIALYSFTPFARLDLAVLTALRMGAYQLRYLDRIPRHAAVNESVDLIKASRKTSAAGLGNAILRKIANTKSPPTPSGPAEEFSHPQWLITRWASQFGAASTRGIAAFDQQKPITHFRIRASEQVDAMLAELRADNIEVAPGGLLSTCYRALSGDLTGTRAFLDRRIIIQDEGSQLIAHLAASATLNPAHILDCCAAPGGKTLLLAAAHPGARVIAAELHPHRAARLRDLCAPNITTLVADATALPFRGSSFDLALADVPCTGTGTLARNPEIKWRLAEHDIGELANIQFAIALGALEKLQSGGVLVYSTCSLEREEDEDVVERLLATGNAETVPISSVLPNMRSLLKREQASIRSGDFLRTIPGQHACDGFFAAVLRKTRG